MTLFKNCFKFKKSISFRTVLRMLRSPRTPRGFRQFREQFKIKPVKILGNGTRFFLYEKKVKKPAFHTIVNSLKEEIRYRSFGKPNIKFVRSYLRKIRTHLFSLIN